MLLFCLVIDVRNATVNTVAVTVKCMLRVLLTCDVAADAGVVYI